jgi:ribosomal protein S12 methylthiotransferase
VLKVTGPHAYEDVMNAVHEHLPPRHDPFVDLVPAAGRAPDAAPLRLSEDFGRLQQQVQLLHHSGAARPAREPPIDEVLREAERLVHAGVRELLVISQDTSAYGVDIRYRTARWREATYETRFIDLARGSDRSAPGCGCTTSILIRMSMRSFR